MKNHLIRYSPGYILLGLVLLCCCPGAIQATWEMTIGR